MHIGTFLRFGQHFAHEKHIKSDKKKKIDEFLILSIAISWKTDFAKAFGLLSCASCRCHIPALARKLDYVVIN